MNNLQTLIAVEVLDLGQIGAGKVVDFVPRSKKRWIPLPHDARAFDVFCDFEVSGSSLLGTGIDSGDYLTCRRNFELWEIKPEKICILLIHPLAELTAKKIRLNNDGTVTISGANPNFEPRTFFADEIEIVALAVEHRRKI